jgi:TrmH family RNA methyltransferase
VFRQKPVSENPADSADLPRDEEAILAQADAPVVDAEAEENSPNPPWFRKLLALTTEKGREREGRFLAEGARVTQEMIDNHRDLIIGIYITDKGMNDPIVAKANEFAITVHTLTPEQMKKLSSTVSAQEIITVCRIASIKPDYEHSRSIITLVDAVQDPGNLGAIFRTSLGFESSGVILGKGTVNPFNPKVVRGSSGTFLRVPFERDIDLVEHINFLRLKGYTIIATDLHAKQSLKEIKPSKMRKVAFLMGNEGAGTNQHLIEMADETVRIPMSNNLESLNVAVAHGILSYEMLSLQSNMEKDQSNDVQ